MAESLERFLRETASLPFEWGRRDCTLWVADWWRERFGDDPGAKFRETYSTEAGAEAAHGGDLVGLIDGQVPRKRGAERGDIGVIRVMGREVAAIFTGQFWAVKTERGVLFLRRSPLAVWGR